MLQIIIMLTGAVIVPLIVLWVNSVVAKKERTNQIRIAALDKRFIAHQEAFSVWRKLVHTASSGEDKENIMKAQNWWENNCLYLEPNVRESMRKCINYSSSHIQYLEQHIESEIVNENWKDIFSVGELIEKAVGLPPICDPKKDTLWERKQGQK